ncbi:MAG TPA: sigma-70 family RNA polymerase sigma factor [Planctomycetaceae bacterium]|jgi:RNA polymerase sigma-70 factor (ECF subfamily)|nr:sigma-70 family RNA polymerase sigma factor [Planctomycetaceae bacterium]
MTGSPTAPADEEALVHRLRDGDRGVLGDLFGLHRQRIWRMIRFRMDRRLAARIDPDDVLQEAFLSARTRIDNFLAEPRGSFFVWLRMIALQTLFDQHRHHIGAEMRNAARDVRIDQPDSSNTSLCLAAQLAGTLTSPSQAAAGLEMTQRLEQAIASMAALDQEIIAMRHFEDLTNVESAEALGISPTAASNRYVRAIARLKEILTALGGSEFRPA